MKTLRNITTGLFASLMLLFSFPALSQACDCDVDGCVVSDCDCTRYEEILYGELQARRLELDPYFDYCCYVSNWAYDVLALIEEAEIILDDIRCCGGHYTDYLDVYDLLDEIDNELDDLYDYVY